MIERNIAENVMIQTLAANIRLMRKKSGLNQTDFSKKMGCKQNALSRLERGTYAPTLHFVYMLAKKLKVSPDNLFGRVVEKPLPKTYAIWRKRFAENLRAARQQRGLSQTQVAEAVGTKQPTYCRLEAPIKIRDNPTRLASPDIETIRRISIVLRVDPLSLFLD